MRKEINVVQVIGKNHVEIMGRSEDAVLIEENDQFLCLGIADGKSGCKYGKEGGEIALKALFNYINHTGILQIIDGKYEDEKKYEIVKTIRRDIEEAAVNLCTLDKEMASTIVAIVIDKINNYFLTIHLGDGCIIGITKKKEVVMLSTPCNGVTSNYTWLTTGEGAPYHMKFVNGELKDLINVYIMSDGVDCICCGGNILLEGKCILRTGDSKKVFKFIEQSEPLDDATCIAIKINM